MGRSWVVGMGHGLPGANQYPYPYPQPMVGYWYPFLFLLAHTQALWDLLGWALFRSALSKIFQIHVLCTCHTQNAIQYTIICPSQPPDQILVIIFSLVKNHFNQQQLCWTCKPSSLQIGVRGSIGISNSFLPHSHHHIVMFPVTGPPSPFQHLITHTHNHSNPQHVVFI